MTQNVDMAVSNATRFMSCVAVLTAAQHACKYLKNPKDAQLYLQGGGEKDSEVLFRAGSVLGAVLAWHPKSSEIIGKICEEGDDFDLYSFAQQAVPLGSSEAVNGVVESFSRVRELEVERLVSSYIENRHPDKEGEPSPYATLEGFKQAMHKKAPAYL